MTNRQKLDERAKAFTRQVLVEDFKQSASDDLVNTVARKVTRAMPTKAMAAMAKAPRSMAEAD